MYREQKVIHYRSELSLSMILQFYRTFSPASDVSNKHVLKYAFPSTTTALSSAETNMEYIFDFAMHEQTTIIFHSYKQR